MFTELKENLEDCNTKSEFSLYFETYNDYSPKNYCRLALRKLPNLTNQQKDDLTDIINDLIDVETNGWKAYCNTLSINQINYVGW